MKYTWHILAFLALVWRPCFAQAPSPFLRSPEVGDRLLKLQARYPQRLTVWSLGKSLEGRPLWACKLGERGPGMVALFAQHSGEHDMTLLALDLLDEALRPQSKLAALLQRTQLVIIPLVNPDGVDFDLDHTPFEWRKNRGIPPDGADLNRNWGYHWDAALEDKELNAPSSDHYRGRSAFSEPETRVVRDFLASWSDLHLLLDYHSGESSFMQGVVQYPFCYSAQECLEPSERLRFVGLSQGFAKEVSDSQDLRTAYFAAELRETREGILAAASPNIRQQVAKLIPSPLLAPGACIDWVYGSLKCTALGEECSRPVDFVKSPLQWQARLARSQTRGLEYLLESLGKGP